MKRQGMSLMTMLASAVRGLDKPDALVPVLKSLGRRHVVYGVKDSHYATVGQAAARHARARARRRVRRRDARGVDAVFP
jgi:hemoglobin-like flavoprotein